MGIEHAAGGVMNGTLGAEVRTTVLASAGPAEPARVDQTHWAGMRPSASALTPVYPIPRMDKFPHM